MNDDINLKMVLENYLKKRINIEGSSDEIDKLILFLDDQYKLSDILDFGVGLVVDK